MTLVVSQLPSDQPPVEFVERKGLGHPDSICDALAETLSRNLCRHYLDRFGGILHHNVDKALLCGGTAAPSFGGGEVLTPIEIYLSGRAVVDVAGKAVPLDEIAIEGSRSWLRSNLHALDADRHVRMYNVVRPGSAALNQLFARGGTTTAGVPLANDTSLAVGYAPMSALERLVRKADDLLRRLSREASHRSLGEDVKIMAVRHGDAVSLTVACAMIGGHLADLDAYLAETMAIRRKLQDLAAESGFGGCRVYVNAADDIAAKSVYLTVTGTSAEAGDDGEVGRGNRVNGLITPGQPMSLEAAAGKNPVSHVGKIYNVIARRIAQTLVSDIAEVAAAQCYMVSQIGRPLTEPSMTHVRLATHDGSPADRLKDRTGEIVGRELRGVAGLVDQFVAGAIELF